MTALAETLKLHFAYSAWASALLVDAAGQITPDELTRDFKTADHSVLGTLVHIFAGDRMWLARAKGNAPTQFLDPERDMHLHVLERDWPAVYEGWSTLLTSVDPDTLVDYRDLKGNPWQTPLSQIAMHVVNHATHHRGQVSGFLRSMGHIPPSLDEIRFYRGLT